MNSVMSATTMFPPTMSISVSSVRRCAPMLRLTAPANITSAPRCSARSPSRQHDVRRAEDLHVEPVGVVPPVVERRRDEHRDAAPAGDERAERPAEPEHAHDRPAARRRPERGRDDLRQRRHRRQHRRRVDRHVRRRPEAVAPDRPVPGDVPVHAKRRRERRSEGEPERPGGVPFTRHDARNRGAQLRTGGGDCHAGKHNGRADPMPTDARGPELPDGSDPPSAHPAVDGSANVDILRP